MAISEKLRRLDELKDRLDSFRPFPPPVVAELKKLYDVVYAQERQGDTGRLLELVADASRDSLIERLRIISTAE